jgi:archaellum biogenesis protein FlaJ (TadC family)
MESNFWALILGLMATIFVGYAFCYGLVKFIEKLVQQFQAKRVVVPSLPTIPRAA